MNYNAHQLGPWVAPLPDGQRYGDYYNFERRLPVEKYLRLLRLLERAPSGYRRVKLKDGREINPIPHINWAARVKRKDQAYERMERREGRQKEYRLMARLARRRQRWGDA